MNTRRTPSDHLATSAPSGSASVRWRRSIAVVLTAGAIVFTFLAASGAGASRSNSPLDLSGSDPVTGKPVSLASFRDKPIVLNAWASWCAGCAAEARALAQFARSHPQAQVIGIDIQDSKNGAKSFYRRFGWHHPSISDPSGKLAVRLGVQGLPTTLFLDRQHRVVAQITGETNLDGFNKGYTRSTK